MKGVKGRILKKLKSIPEIPYLKQPQSFFQLQDPSSPLESDRILSPTKEFDEHAIENKENFSQNSDENQTQTAPKCQSFRKPDPDSATLFDPKLLAAFHQAVIDYFRNQHQEEVLNENFPTTSLRGIRKTFEDCSSIKLLLENLKLVFIERDVSMHIEFRDELWRVLGYRAIPPRLFIRGRCIGGADEVLGLHERGGLIPLVEGIARTRNGERLCGGCNRVRFVVCIECDGGRKVFDEEKGMNVQCLRCNENGLVVCPLCC
ncbi:uncharacterized protein A4U43_C07F33730 [Asparagus officinalis]|uniref:Glutaredoxin domain-containing protein n=1 Tax=Asparagus officinalis TaxID=4686 RepID=A0A5P1EGS8_ASPOF|nr:uncharacterized protein At5g39865-like [Asparagus officinalis]ONK65105.1 uncharacterized protein A4U43_C07F33730 [Asparagus officinalis]